MGRSVKRIDLIWGYSSLLLNVGGGMLLLPVLVVTLSREELGLWYVFMTMLALAQLLEFGFQPTIARQVAYLYCGATDIRGTGLPITEGSKLNSELLINVFYASKKIYRVISLLVAVSLLGAGTLYVNSLKFSGDLQIVYTSWCAFSLASIINLYFGYYNAMLQGRGDVTKVNKSIVISRLVLLIVAVILLLLKFGLIGMAVAHLISCVTNRFLIGRYFYDKENEFLIGAIPTKKLAAILWSGSWRMGLVQLGAFLIQRGNLFIAATCLGLSMAASYGLTLQIAMLIMAFSLQLASLLLPKMNAMQVSGNRDALVRMYSLSVVAGMLISIFSFFLIILLGDKLLELANSETKLLSTRLLLLLAVVLLLEVHHSISATYLTTCNYVPFLLASIISGIAVVSVSYFLVRWGGMGVAGLIVGQGLVQIIFNNWYWPIIAMRHLNVSFLNVLFVGSKSLYNLVIR